MIVIVFDRLPASSLGCYGSFACETPNFDLLAAQGVVFDQCFIDSSVGLKVPARALQITSCGGGNSAEVERFRQALAVKADGQFWCRISVPSATASERDDFEMRLQEHFAQVRQCDALLGELIGIIAEEDEQRPLIVTGSAGDPIAIRTAHPTWLKTICEEVTHVPLIMVAEGPSSSRCRSLVSTTSVEGFLGQSVPKSAREFVEQLEQWQSSLDSSAITWNSASARTCRTANWLAVLPVDDALQADASQVQLFAKPEDRWEQLNVAQQYPAVVEDLFKQAGWGS